MALWAAQALRHSAISFLTREKNYGVYTARFKNQTAFK